MNEIIAVVVTPEHRQVLETYLMDLLDYTELRMEHTFGSHKFIIPSPERVDVCIFSSSNQENFQGLEFSNVLIDEFNENKELERRYFNQLRLKEKRFYYFYNPKEAYEIITKIFKSRGWY